MPSHLNFEIYIVHSLEEFGPCLKHREEKSNIATNGLGQEPYVYLIIQLLDSTRWYGIIV